MINSFNSLNSRQQILILVEIFVLILLLAFPPHVAKIPQTSDHSITMNGLEVPMGNYFVTSTFSGSDTCEKMKFSRISCFGEYSHTYKIDLIRLCIQVLLSLAIFSFLFLFFNEGNFLRRNP
ncbi:MAG TPA: hypothetical protein PKA63_01860 [Oligoflexia bacterium]|nr:hypothetical protein [Oligoflexia bacterium]HMP47395.1 hypothetical protein [Oligoflexia bacterium]